MSEVTMSFVWNDEHQSRLRCLHMKGLSFTQIAAEIGCTRNAAIGKAHRLGLSEREAAKPVPKPPPSPARRVVNAIRKIFAVAKEVVDDKDYCCCLIELTDTRCRFPLWRHDAPPYSAKLYCGAPGAEMSAGKPYCKKHALLCNPQR